MWFERLTGFPEISPAQVREQLELAGPTLTSRVNGRCWTCGTLEVVSLAALRERVAGLGRTGSLRVSEKVADVQALHADPGNAGALFQVASQFNLLEMVHPDATPEEGVGIYEHDRTQGPACAIAAGAGTIFRNYFAPTAGGIGQSRTHQIDCLAQVGAMLGNEQARLWEMRNGYALATEAGLDHISRWLAAASPEERDALRGALQVGFQRGTQVTIRNCSHLVSQVYCSALPVAYSPHPAEAWRDFAVLVLEAAYEAAVCAAVLNADETGNDRVFLTLLGGGAFGNEEGWIISAIERALRRHNGSGLDVRLVSFGSPRPALQPLVRMDWDAG